MTSPPLQEWVYLVPAPESPDLCGSPGDDDDGSSSSSKSQPPCLDTPITTLNLPLIGVVEKVESLAGKAAAGLVDLLVAAVERYVWGRGWALQKKRGQLLLCYIFQRIGSSLQPLRQLVCALQSVSHRSS